MCWNSFGNVDLIQKSDRWEERSSGAKLAGDLQRFSDFVLAVADTVDL
jgi:hypothetical protein